MAHISDLIASDIEHYLHAHEHKSLLRFITCGSVDDGKSTLIGRLLYDSKMLFEDQLAALEADSKKVGTQGGELDFALLVDGLAAEREQGITIDVAYRFFSTDKRKFIVADTPGHEQYTRNMVTGASTADLAVILIDARKGVLTQTRRHSYLVSLLGIRQVVLAVNKMDLVGYSRGVFDAIDAGLPRRSPSRSASTSIVCDPAVGAAGRQHHGPERAHALVSRADADGVPRDRRGRRRRSQQRPFRLPVQWVNRPNLDFRGFAGTHRERHGAAGRPRPRAALGQRKHGRAHRHAWTATCDQRVAGQSVTLTLDRRDRRQPRRRARRGRTTCRGRRPVRGDRRLDERGADAARPALPVKIGTQDRRRDDRGAEVQGQRQHARAPGGRRSSS